MARPRRERIESRIFADFRRASFAHGFSRAAVTAQYTAWQPGPQAPPVEGTRSSRLRACADAHTTLCVLRTGERVPVLLFSRRIRFPIVRVSLASQPDNRDNVPRVPHDEQFPSDEKNL